MPSVGLPTGNNERVTWSINFEAEFPPLSSGLGFSTAETTELLNHVINLRFIILRAQRALAFSKACSQYKHGMLGGVEATQDAPVLPVFTDLSVPNPLVEAGIVPFINNALQRIKLSKGYSEAVGQTLMIAGTQEEPANLGTAKPTAQCTALADFTARIDWAKLKFDGVVIDSKRGDQTEWTRLDFDTRSPYEDTRPPLVAGQPEERRYRLRYFIDDQLVGEWSDDIVVITRP